MLAQARCLGTIDRLLRTGALRAADGRLSSSKSPLPAQPALKRKTDPLGKRGRMGAGPAFASMENIATNALPFATST